MSRTKDDEYEFGEKIVQDTHLKVNETLSGIVNVLRSGFAKVSLITTPEMAADDMGLVHGGFIFSAADHAAMVAVNEKNVVLASVKSNFLSPVRVGDEVSFEARLRHKEGRKRLVTVRGFVLDVKVFEGEFSTVVTDRHVLQLKLMKEE